MKFRTWALQVVLLAVAFTAIFGLAFGKRGLALAVYVVVLSLVLPSAVWLVRRNAKR